MARAPTVKLNSGFEMPVLGLGTFSLNPTSFLEPVKYAIDRGYRHIDTGLTYGSEKDIGVALKEKIAEGVIKREDMFITTKLWCIHHEPDKVEHGCRLALKNLGLEYIDLYLMHFPVGFILVDDETYQPKKPGSDVVTTNDVDYVDTWKAMEKLVEKGLVRSIGLSNFNAEQTERVLKICKIRPVVNEVECNVEINQSKLLKFCKDRDIILMDYCPVVRANPAKKTPACLYNDRTQAIADKYKKTPVQIALKYLVQRGTVPVPGALEKPMIDENIDIFDFKLTADEMKYLDSLNTGKRICEFEFVDKNHKYYPFNAEF
ncbi:unnamed protein product [Hermetia illucens]|uniref:NADP-dependent oxidoreductase domain-containing protein n=1 Tax=Hermetia illucens TaxID=343691 RepID=A0A7R8YSX7_HERIL|nr:aldo-keto reductase family 1 member B1-like [Hermetia illucens]CAD7083085.1 unnamed protein product [Hermetia illucens]